MAIKTPAHIITLIDYQQAIESLKPQIVVKKSWSIEILNCFVIKLLLSDYVTLTSSYYSNTLCLKIIPKKTNQY